MEKRVKTNTYVKTQHLAEKMAKKCLKSGPDFKNNQALIFAMMGNLGTGKTTFVQGFSKGLEIVDKILSPTFVILKKFQIPKSEFQYFYHIDCYRIKQPKEILDLGFKEIISDPRNIIVIEWSENINSIIPKNSIFLEFKFKGNKIREIIIKDKHDFK